MERLAAGLSNDSTAIRDLAVQTLMHSGNRLATENRLDVFWVAAPALIQWVRSQNTLRPPVKTACRLIQVMAAHAIQATRFESALFFLDALASLSTPMDRDAPLRDFADEMRRAVAEKDALRILSVGMLRSEPPESDHATRCLVRLTPHSGEALLDLLATAEDRSERVRIMRAIRETEKSLLPLVVKRIDPGAPWYFLRNLAALVGILGEEAHLGAITPLLKHHDLRVQREALNTVYNIGGTRRREILLSYLASAEEEMKTPVVIMLGGLRQPEAVGPLLELLKNRPLIPSQNRFRLEEALCKALGRIGDPRALPVLTEIAEPKRMLRVTAHSERVKAAAKDAVETIESRQREQSERREPMNTPGNSRQSEIAGFPENDDSKSRQQVDALIDKGDKSGAVALLSRLIQAAARAKDFQKADAFLEKMAEADPMALSEIYTAGERIEAEKAAALDKDRMASWGALYDTLTKEETHAFYFALKERRLDADVSLICQGQKNDALYFVEQGELKVIFERQRQDYLVRHLKAGNVAGTESFFNPTVSTVSVITQTATMLNVLDLEALSECKKKAPALENKLRAFCEGQNNNTRRLLDKALERRLYPRFSIEGGVTVQLLYASGRAAGKAFKGRLIDLSAGGLCFFIKLQNKESARMLLGRRLQLQFPSKAAPTGAVFEGGMVVAVHYHLSLDYSVHVRFDTPMEAAAVETIVKGLEERPTTPKPSGSG
jgi:HEAT repeat protein